MPATDLKSEAELNTLLKGYAVLDFWADWAAPCAQLNEIFDQLADSNKNLKFVKVGFAIIYDNINVQQIEAEKFDTITEKFGVDAVPCFVFVKDGKVINTVQGANAPQVADKVLKYNQEAGSSGAAAPAKEALEERLKKLVNYAPVMLFMKGTPDAPQCGFSAKIVEILKRNNIQFSSFNILSDEGVRQGLKTFSNWPTYPQLYSKGKLIGGLDVVKELEAEGELLSSLA